jgi:prevent-host-death family protein
VARLLQSCWQHAGSRLSPVERALWYSDHGIGLWYKLNMREIAISKFKATCLAVLEDVRRTGASVRVTRFGRPVAEVVPTRPETASSWLGCAKHSIEITGDITEPVGAFSRWTVRK